MLYNRPGCVTWYGCPNYSTWFDCMKMVHLFNRLYRAATSPIAFRFVLWTIGQTGPLAPALFKVGRWVHAPVRRLLYAVTLPNPVQVDGLYLYHDERAAMVTQSATQELAMGTFEGETVRVFKDMLKPGMTVLDIGANIGYYSLLAAQVVGDEGAVWAFEPTPSVVALLRKNVEVNGFESRIRVVPQAVGNKCGIARLYVNVTENVFSSLYEEASTHQVGTAANRYNYVDVACTTLDEWAAQHDWPRVDLIKMDTEGGEQPALEGMIELSRRNPHLKLIVEFNVRTLRAAGTTVDAFFAALHACGFHEILAIGTPLRPLDIPADIPWLVHEVRRLGGDALNILCKANSA